jgi:hypothetical protein
MEKVIRQTTASAPSNDAQGSTSNASQDSQQKESNKLETAPAPSQASSNDALTAK